MVDTVCESPAVNYETVIRFKSTLKRVAQDLLDFAYSRDENYRDMIKVFLAKLKCRYGIGRYLITFNVKLKDCRNFHIILSRCIRRLYRVLLFWNCLINFLNSDENWNF